MKREQPDRRVLLGDFLSRLDSQPSTAKPIGIITEASQHALETSGFVILIPSASRFMGLSINGCRDELRDTVVVSCAEDRREQDGVLWTRLA